MLLSLPVAFGVTDNLVSGEIPETFYDLVSLGTLVRDKNSIISPLPYLSSVHVYFIFANATQRKFIWVAT